MQAIGAKLEASVGAWFALPVRCRRASFRRRDDVTSGAHSSAFGAARGAVLGGFVVASGALYASEVLCGRAAAHRSREVGSNAAVCFAGFARSGCVESSLECALGARFTLLVVDGPEGTATARKF